MNDDNGLTEKAKEEFRDRVRRDSEEQNRKAGEDIRKFDDQEDALRALFEFVLDAVSNVPPSSLGGIPADEAATMASYIGRTRSVGRNEVVSFLKAVLSSQETDEIRLESYAQVEIPVVEKLGAVVALRLRALGLTREDLQDYVERHTPSP